MTPETYLPVPDVPDQYADAQVASPSLGTGGIQHSGTKHPKFELADAALHAEQQPVIRLTRVIDAVEIDDPGVNEPAKLQQVVPVPAVARQAGSVEAQNRTDLPGAQPCHEPIEARARHCSAGGATEIIIDDFYIAESVTPGDLDQLILTPAALLVGLHLAWGGLAHVDDGLAAQYRGRETVSARHRLAPRSGCQRPPSVDW